MSSYKLADFLSQQIPDHLMLDIALHFQANDNRHAGKQSRQWDTPVNPPSRQADTATSWQGHNAGDPQSFPRGVSDINEHLGSLWSWCRTAVRRPLEAFLSWMADRFLAGMLDRQPA